MITERIIRGFRAGTLLAGGLLLAGSLPHQVSAQDVDPRWLPWLGCWEAVEGADLVPFVEAYRGTSVALCGEGAGELIAPLTLAVQAGLDRASLRNWILPHPGYSEVFQGLFRS